MKNKTGKPAYPKINFNIENGYSELLKKEMRLAASIMIVCHGGFYFFYGVWKLDLTGPGIIVLACFLAAYWFFPRENCLTWLSDIKENGHLLYTPEELRKIRNHRIFAWAVCIVICLIIDYKNFL